jgi:hypothetical protein
MSSLGSLTQPYSPLNLIMSALGIGSAAQAQEQAKKQNQGIALSGSNIIGGSSGGGVGYAGMENGIPGFNVDLNQSTNQGYGNILNALLSAQKGNTSDFKSLMGQLQGQQGTEQGNLLNSYQGMSRNLQGQYGQGAQGLLSAAQQRQQTGMGYLDNAGKQETADLNKQYAAQGNAAQMQMAQRGFGSGNLLQGASALNERERQDSLNRLNESVNAQKQSAFSGYSGDVLNTQAQNFGNQMNLASGLAQGQFGVQSQQSSDRQNLLSQLLGQQYGMNTQNRTDVANLVGQQQQTLMGLNQASANNALNLVTGVTGQQPSMTPWQVGSQMGQAYEGNQANVAAQNLQTSMQHQAQWAPWQGMGMGLLGTGTGMTAGAGLGSALWGG